MKNTAEIKVTDWAEEKGFKKAKVGYQYSIQH